MSFLTPAELTTVSTPEIVNLITHTNNSIVEDIIAESIELMEGYLYQYYDTDTIFAATGPARSKVLLRLLKKIVIHELFVRRSRQMNEVVANGYKEAMAWLEDVAAGSIKPKLAPKLVDVDGDGLPDTEAQFMKLGSNKNYNNHW